MATLTDPALARRLLTNALAGTPTLSEAQMDDLMVIAATEDELGDTVYEASALNRAAALGWSWKASLTADKYDLGGGQGRTLDRSQWFAHCLTMQQQYASGASSVVGSVSGRRSGIGSIGLVSSLSVETDEVW